MPVRKPALDEWFLAYQLEAIQRRHFHLPFALDADVTAIASAYAARGLRPNWTAILVKSAGLLAERHPAVNRVVFRTPFGMRMLEPAVFGVNVPVMLRDGDRRCLSATTIRDPRSKTVEAILGEIRESAARPVAGTLVGRFVYGHRNHFLNRLRLRFIHFVVHRFPSVYERAGGGALSVSSLMNVHDGVTDVRIQAYGHTAFTLGLASVLERDGRFVMRLGIAYDHAAFSGEEAARFVNSLGAILEGREAADLAALGPST